MTRRTWREHECFDVCANAWGGYIGGSLRKLITTGVGTPNVDTVADEIKADATVR